MRVWLKGLMLAPKASARLTELIGDRVYAGEAVATARVIKPFVFYTIGNSTSENLSEEPVGPQRQFFQIYVHDSGTDYTQIDEIVGLVKEALEAKSSAPDAVMTIQYLETSRDLDDETMGTILRYIRFLAIKER